MPIGVRAERGGGDRGARRPESRDGGGTVGVGALSLFSADIHHAPALKLKLDVVSAFRDLELNTVFILRKA